MLKLSVALCSYNGEKFLHPQLRSIAEQTRPPDELVVCDDRSTDATGSILEEFSKEATFPVRIEVNSSNLGSTRNFEKAISLCSGDVIALCDQDDVWAAPKLARLMEALDADSRLDVVFSDAEITDGDMRLLGTRLWDSVGFSRAERRSFEGGDAFKVLIKHNVVTGATMAFRSRMRTRALPIPPLWVHDGWIALLAAVSGGIAMLPEPMIRYRRHAAQQIGAGGNPFRKRLEIALSMDASFFARSAQRYREAMERVLATEGDKVGDRIRKGFAEKIAHFERRAALPASRFARISPALRELLSLRYHRYDEHGTIGFLQDLIRSSPGSLPTPSARK
ncbi:MAG: glycosyltransferase family 2 protein [Deltaproteobacteria bacterium]|nr:glycosyltransferase family 2 protein [Deltaproteobacteria bacterium]